MCHQVSGSINRDCAPTSARPTIKTAIIAGKEARFLKYSAIALWFVRTGAVRSEVSMATNSIIVSRSRTATLKANYFIQRRLPDVDKELSTDIGTAWDLEGCHFGEFFLSTNNTLSLSA